MDSTPRQTPLLVDGHVHLRACFESLIFLESAATNFAQASSWLGFGREATGVLLLAEASGEDGLRRLRRRREALGSWRIVDTEETGSMVFQAPDRTTLVVIAGRQVVTQERLEVLALASSTIHPDGVPFLDALRAALEGDAVVVIPYGFGKWWGARGALVRSALESGAFEGVLLGDNGGRLSTGPSPRLLRDGRERGIIVLPGSDPLPWPAEVRRVGANGFVLEGAVDCRRPMEGLGRMIRGLEDQPLTFGKLSNPWQFVTAQLRARFVRSPGP